VSYALSGKRSISAETQERSAQPVLELGFHAECGSKGAGDFADHGHRLFVHFFADEFSPAMLSVRAAHLGCRAWKRGTTS